MKRFRFALMLSLLAATLFGAASAAEAQAGLYTTFTATRLNIPQTSWIYGPTFGAYYDAKRFSTLKPGLDVRGSFLFGKANEQFFTGMGGPRLVFEPKRVPLKPYAEALFGIGSVTYGLGFPSTTSTKFEYEFLGGADLRVASRLDWRVIEFGVGHLTDVNGTYYPKSISTGLVFRFP